MKSVLRTAKAFVISVRSFIGRLVSPVGRFVKQHPYPSFLGLLALVVLLSIIGNAMRKPAAVKTVAAPAKTVDLYSIGSSPKVTVSAKIEKTGTVKIIAQSAGIVQSVFRKEGDGVGKGTQLMWLSTTATGGSVPTVQRQIAETNYQYVKDNYDTQKDLIAKRRDIAEKTRGQIEEQRKLGEQTVDETQSLIDLNDQILSTLDSQLTNLESNNSEGSNSALILQTKQAKAGVMAGQNSLKNAIRTTQYQTDSEHEPTKLADLQRETTLKGLDLEARALDLNREISKLNYTLALISEALMYPASPIEGTVERIYVTPGSTVSPGTLLASVNGTKKTATAVAAVSGNLAQRISRIEKSVMHIAGTSVEIDPAYISREPTEGQFRSVLYRIPPELEAKLDAGSVITVDIPVTQDMTNAADPFVPLDAIYQTQEGAFLYVAKAGKNGKFTAESRQVSVGSMFGKYAEVLTGLSDKDQVIVTRNVIAGDTVEPSGLK